MMSLEEKSPLATSSSDQETVKVFSRGVFIGEYLKKILNSNKVFYAFLECADSNVLKIDSVPPIAVKAIIEHIINETKLSHLKSKLSECYELKQIKDYLSYFDLEIRSQTEINEVIFRVNGIEEKRQVASEFNHITNGPFEGEYGRQYYTNTLVLETNCGDMFTEETAIIKNFLYSPFIREVNIDGFVKYLLDDRIVVDNEYIICSIDPKNKNLYLKIEDFIKYSGEYDKAVMFRNFFSKQIQDSI